MGTNIFRRGLLILRKQLVGKRALLPVSSFNAEKYPPEDRPGKLFEVGTHDRMPRWVVNASGRVGQYRSPQR